VRTFVAVFPPPEVRKALSRAAYDLPASKGFRLIDPEKLHLTLKFLGDVAEHDLGRVTQALGPLGENHEPFEVSTSHFEAFPSERRARAVARDVEKLLEPAGFPREKRPYLPHLTLGRARGRRAELEDTSVSPPTLRFTVSGVELVESVPVGGGVAYSVLETCPF
jgi:2'-5' RNA ligase